MEGERDMVGEGGREGGKVVSKDWNAFFFNIFSKFLPTTSSSLFLCVEKGR